MGNGEQLTDEQEGKLEATGTPPLEAESKQLAAHLEATDRADLIRGILVLSPFILFGFVYLIGAMGLADTTLGSIAAGLWFLSIPTAILIVLFGFGLRILGAIVGTVSTAWHGGKANQLSFGEEPEPQRRGHVPPEPAPAKGRSLEAEPKPLRSRRIQAKPAATRGPFDAEEFGHYFSENLSETWYARTSKPYTPVHGLTDGQKAAIEAAQARHGETEARREETEYARAEAAELRARLHALDPSSDEEFRNVELSYEEEIELLYNRLDELEGEE